MTRMHSSRMRTGRSLTVCQSLLPGRRVSSLGGVCLVPEGVCLVPGGVSGPEGCLVPGGCLVQGVSAPGGV